MAIVGLEQTFYNVSESVGVVEVCVVVYEPAGTNCPINFPFEVLLSTEDGTAGIHIHPLYPFSQSSHLPLFFSHISVASMDYNPLIDFVVEFNSCDQIRCTDIIIRDDLITEDIESFFVNLERTDDLSITISLNPIRAEIQIIDANGESAQDFDKLVVYKFLLSPEAVVGLERTFYSASESDVYVEVCAVVHIPDITVPCPIDIPFEVELSTTDGTAGNVHTPPSLILNGAACN